MNRMTPPLWWATLLMGAVFVAACSDDDPRPSAAGFSGSSGPGSGSGSGSGAAPNVGGEDGDAGDGGDDSSTGGHVAAVLGCGDGVRAPGEACDGTDLGSATCQTLGYDSGALACSFDCSFDDSDCEGQERCADGRDNDKDGLTDCGDGDDCELACSSPCAAPDVLPDPAEITASTLGRAALDPLSCLPANALPGASVAYLFKATESGRVEIELESELPHLVAILGEGCTPDGELACDARRLSHTVEAGDELRIVVQSIDPDVSGPFTLRVASHAAEVCGDGYRDPNEACEDGALEPLDGCDSTCQLERDENEPNSTAADAESYSAGYVASIDPEADQDLIAVSVEVGPASIAARTSGFLDECESGRVDTFLELLDGDASSLLDSDDDESDGYCSRVVATGLAQGTYYLRVSAAQGADFSTFPYRLLVTVNACGDGLRGPGEACDDYNQKSGDGCSAACQEE